MTATFAAPSSGYAPVNGQEMYYEIRGTGQPLVLLHGAYGAIATWGTIPESLAQTRQVIAVELQGHGHTADIARPLRYEQMADDTAALLGHLGVAAADIFGYSMGGGIALQMALRHPAVVRKLVVASASFTSDGIYPEVLAMIETITPEMFAGSPMEAAYREAAPNPDDWPTLVTKLKQLDAEAFSWSPDAVRAIVAPTLVILGDSDVIRPEHALELFRLRGGGIAGDMTGLPAAQLAVLPGTTHVGLMDRADWLLLMIPPFLDAPMPDSR